MDRPRSLKVNFFWQFMTNGLAALAQLLIVTALAKLTSKTITGEFIFAWSLLCSPLFSFAGLDLRAVQATDLRGEFSFVDQFAIRLITGFVAGLVAIGCVLGMDWSDSLLWVVVATSIGKYCELVGETFVGLMQRHERFDLVARTTAIRATVSCVSMCLPVLATRDIVLSAGIWAACSLLALGFIEIPLGRQFLERVPTSDSSQDAGAVPQPSLWRTGISQAGMLSLLKLGFPLAMRALLVSLIPSVARSFVVAYHGMSTFGVFGAIFQLTMAAILFSRMLNPAVAPRLSRYLRDGDLLAYRRLLRQLRLFYLALAIVSLLVVGLFGRWLLEIWFKPEYAEHHFVFFLAMIATATLFQGGVLDMALVTLRKADSLAKTSLVTLCTMIVSGWLLIPGWGMEGAAVSLALSWGVRGLYLQTVLSRALRDIERQYPTVQEPSAN